MKIRKGDKVVVIAGKDKGREGVVTRALPAVDKVIVENVNVAKRHTKPRSQDNPGGIIDKEMPIHVSNVAIVSPKDNKATRVGYKFVDDKNGGQRKVRICKRTGVEIPEGEER